MSRRPVVVVLPAYQAQATLAATVGEIPAELGAELLVVDDASTDRTVEVARSLGLSVTRHPSNRGYGANQKTCYQQALERGAGIVIMLHPDFQYDARALPGMVDTIERGGAALVLGSRLMGSGGASPGGMAWWRRLGNRALTTTQNRWLGLNLSEYHTGLRAYSREALERIPWQHFNDDFVFDQEMIAAAARLGLPIAEVPVRARYFREASSIPFHRAVRYGVATLSVCWPR